MSSPATQPISTDAPAEPALTPEPETGAVAPIAAPATLPAPVMASPFGTVSLWPAVVSSIFSIFEMLLGGYLLLAGIQLLRYMASSRKHHLRYAMIKIPVTILSAAAAGLATYEMQRAVFAGMASVQPTVIPNMALYTALASTMINLALSLAYPVALLILLSRPQIKLHFAEMR